MRKAKTPMATATRMAMVVVNKRTDLATVFARLPGYSVNGDSVEFEGKEVALLYKKNKLYSNLLAPMRVDYRKFVSKKLLPDDAVLVAIAKTLFIVETKFQTVAGSVDEKLQTCAFKLEQYKRLI